MYVSDRRIIGVQIDISLLRVLKGYNGNWDWPVFVLGKWDLGH